MPTKKCKSDIEFSGDTYTLPSRHRDWIELWTAQHCVLPAHPFDKDQAMIALTEVIEDIVVDAVYTVLGEDI